MDMENWQGYAACWSAGGDEQRATLATLVRPDVVYRDPQIEVGSDAELIGYMQGFQQAFPGHRFEIVAVAAHHDRSLAQWRQVDRDGNVAVNGTSAARHDEDGLFAEITGFFGIG